LAKAQGCTQMRLIENVPESHYCLTVNLRVVRKQCATSRKANAGRVSLPRSNADRTDVEWTSKSMLAY